MSRIFSTKAPPASESSGPPQATSVAPRRPGKRGGRFARVMGVIRLSTYLAVVSLGVGLLAARTGYTHMRGAGMMFGDEILRLTDLGEAGDYYRLRLNGQTVNVASASTDRPVSAVLDIFQQGCTERADQLSLELANLKRALGAPAPPSVATGAPGIGILRNELNGRGFVLCFAQDRVTDQFTAYRNLQEFAVTGDLGKVGKLRYIAARRTAAGGALAVGVWVDGPLPLAEMFPLSGDAPGTDIEGVLRPKGTRRIFTAYAEASPYGISVYESERAPAALLEELDKGMPSLGWQAVPAFDERTPNARAFTRPGADIIVTAEESRRGAVLAITTMAPR